MAAKSTKNIQKENSAKMAALHPPRYIVCVT